MRLKIFEQSHSAFCGTDCFPALLIAKYAVQQEEIMLIKNISNDNRKLLYFYFDEDETPHLFTEQDAPKEGYIVDGKIVYDRYSGENKLEFIYSY